jgi:hypothetical protein
MNRSSIVLRWYRQTTSGASSPGEEYTAHEVYDLLRGEAGSDPDRAEAVRVVAAQPGGWLEHLTKQHRREIGDLADRLPSLVFQHAIGGSTDEMVDRFGGWSTWRYDRALDIACACIASQLNQVRLAV